METSGLESALAQTTGAPTASAWLFAASLAGCAPAELPPAANPGAPGIGPAATGTASPRPATSPTGDEAAVGSRVLSFAEANLGRLVGGGECAELADHALRASGARTFSDYTAVTQGDDYVWGRPISLRDARPGDILQFRDFVSRMSTRTPYGESGSDLEYEHHTAILEANLGDAFLILEQNGTTDRTVQRTTIPIRSRIAETSIVVSGTISVYRPQANERS